MKKVLTGIIAALAIAGTAFAAGNYKLDVKVPDSATKGKPAVVRVHVEGTNGSVVNVDYPVQLVITPPAGVQVAKATMTKADATKFATGGADFDVTFTSADAGPKAFTGELKFAVAKGKDTTPATEKVAFSVTVK